MKKSQLRTGMLVVNRQGDKAIVFKYTERGSMLTGSKEWDEKATWCDLESYNTNLLYKNKLNTIVEADIMQVYSLPVSTGNMDLFTASIVKRELLFDRNNPNLNK